MRERLIGDWLARANERSFQIPFCWWLTAQGYRVLHMTRHSAMELGKDIIAIGPDGKTPFVYQLKGTQSRITMSVWRGELQGQLFDAAYAAPVHPSLPADAPHHRTFLVTNGSLDEEVSQVIKNINDQCVKDGRPEKQISTIVGLEMLAGFIEMAEEFWPTDLVDTRTYLELYLDDGRGRLAKAKLADLLSSTLDLDGESAWGERRVAQSIAAAALVCSAATEGFVRESNWVALFEAWTIFLSSLLACAEKRALPAKLWIPWAELASDIMRQHLRGLVDEIRTRDGIIDGHPFVEKLTLHVKMVELAGLVALFCLWSKDDVDAERREYAESWLRRNVDKIMLPGEYAAPLYFTVASWFRRRDATVKPDVMLLRAIDTILARNGPTELPALMNPYYDADDVLMAESGLDSVDEDFKGASYALSSFVYVLARRMWKSPLVDRWDQITRVDRREFVPDGRMDWLRWRRRESGEYVSATWEQPQQWMELLGRARLDDVSRLPSSLMNNVFWYLSFVSVYPHRFSDDGARWADSQLWEQA